MKSKIYKITNTINDKVYVGKTMTSLKKRFQQHLWDGKRARAEKRPLYRAMKKYGSENFSIHLIEECTVERSNEREIYWIKKYRGYSEGYNATTGGDGVPLYNYNEIKKLIENDYRTVEITQMVGCCEDLVRKVAKNFNLTINSNRGERAVKQYTLDDKYIQTFNSYASAARWLESEGVVKGHLNGVRSHIGEVCDGKRKTAYKYKWRRC